MSENFAPSGPLGASTQMSIKALAPTLLCFLFSLFGLSMARQTIPTALDSAGTAFTSALAAYEGVAKVEQLPVAVKHATLQTAIDRAVRNIFMLATPFLCSNPSLARLPSVQGKLNPRQP
jgi:hypothetical protein